MRESALVHAESLAHDSREWVTLLVTGFNGMTPLTQLAADQNAQLRYLNSNGTVDTVPYFYE